MSDVSSRNVGKRDWLSWPKERFQCNCMCGESLLEVCIYDEDGGGFPSQGKLLHEGSLLHI